MGALPPSEASLTNGLGLKLDRQMMENCVGMNHGEIAGCDFGAGLTSAPGLKIVLSLQ